MPNTNLILRTLTSPYGDNTLGSVLSHADLDNNFIYLKGEIIQDVSLLGANLILTKIDGTTLNVNLNSIAGGGGGSSAIVTGGTYDNITGTATFTNSTGGTFVVSGFSTTSSSGITYTNLTPTTQTIGGIAAGSTFSAQTMQQMWDSLLYPYQPPAFTSFSLQGITSPYEIGRVITTSQTFLWGTSNPSNVSANTISIAGYNLTTLTGLANDSSEPVTFTSQVTRFASAGPGVRSWSITGTNTKNNTFTKNLDMRWDYILYVGDSANTSLTASEIKALTTYNSVKNGFAGSYSFPAANTYKYICYADTYGQPTSFIAGGFPVAMWGGYANSGPGAATYDLVPVTNTYGETTNYRVYRTTNKLNGATTIIVS